MVSLEVQKSVARAHDIVSKEFLPDPRHEDLYLCFPLRVSQFQLLHLGLSPLLVHFCVWRQAGIGGTWGSSFPDVRCGWTGQEVDAGQPVHHGLPVVRGGLCAVLLASGASFLGRHGGRAGPSAGLRPGPT